MATPFEEIYSGFLGKIVDFDFLEYEQSELEEELMRKLKSACARFDCDKMSSYDETMEEFSQDLTGLEQEILVCLMLIEWISPKINNVELLKQTLASKDFQMYSQANHLRELRELKKDLNKEAQYLMKRYSYKNV